MTRSHSHPILLSLALVSSVAPATADDVAVTTSVEEPPPRYPRAVIARPLTLPARLVMLGADASSNHDLSAMGGAPIVGAGITDELEIQVPYAFATRELEAKGTLAVDVGYAVVRGALGGKLEAVARVRGGYDLLAEAATPVAIGVHAQYNVTDWLAIISGAPGAQQLRIAVEDDDVMGRPIDVSLPIGVGVQPTGELYLQLDTRLVQLAVSDTETAVIFADTTPVALSAVYNVVDVLDLLAAIGTDLSNEPADAMTFLVGARYYAGRL